MENKTIHILIVDDDDRIRDLLKDYLTKNEYIVSTAENADNAKEKLNFLKFDIIILDVMMPGQNGYDLTKEIKKNTQKFSNVRILSWGFRTQRGTCNRQCNCSFRSTFSKYYFSQARFARKLCPGIIRRHSYYSAGICSYPLSF